MKISEKIFNKIKYKHPWEKFYGHITMKVPNMSLYEYLYKCNEHNMESVAINYFGKKISYRTFFKEIDTCAKALRSQGIREGDVVSVCMANTPEAVISFYAINKIGAISNMIHPLSAEEEIKKSLNTTKSVMLITINVSYKKVKSIIEDTQVYKSVIVSPKDSMPFLLGVGYYLTEDRKINIPTNSEKFLTWKDFMEKGNNYSGEVLVKRSKDQEAVILHSGGTTGEPKNILLNNGNINVVVKQAKVLLPDTNSNDSMLSILPLFHCFGLVECVHFPLCIGASIILVPKFDAKRFDKLITKYKPTIIPGVPTLFEAMLSNEHMDKVDLSNVKYVVSGGDSLNAERNDAINKFLKKHKCHHNIIQGYGMTETSGGCVFGGLGSDVLGSVGIPLPGNEVKIVKIDDHEEAKFGEVGEILISGPTVMMGYLDNEEATNEILEKDKKGKVWVHTGDLGYLNEDGVLFFVQRLKRMLIVSGYNVYPSHIEDVLMKHPAVESCGVIGIPHPYKVQVPKAFIVLKRDVEETAVLRQDIKAYCKKNLAAYMVPKEFVFRESLPKTMVGKIDYKNLKD